MHAAIARNNEQALLKKARDNLQRWRQWMPISHSQMDKRMERSAPQAVGWPS
jgi:hypothetical protein